MPLDPREPSFLIFTSGTESRPKGVVHSVGRYAMTICCFEGALDTPTTARFYEICERHAVTKVLCAPTLIRMLRKFGDDLAGEHPLNLKLITAQGEPLDDDTFAWATETFDVPVVNAYGQAETGSTRTCLVYGEDLKAGSVATLGPDTSSRSSTTGSRSRRRQGLPRAHRAVPNAGAHRSGRSRALHRDVLLPLPRQLRDERRGGARPRRHIPSMPRTRTGRTMRRLLPTSLHDDMNPAPLHLTSGKVSVPRATICVVG